MVPNGGGWSETAITVPTETNKNDKKLTSISSSSSSVPIANDSGNDVDDF